MSLRRFLRALLGRSPERAEHSGDRLASEIRETIGPLGGADGRITGHNVYERLEDRDRG